MFRYLFLNINVGANEENIIENLVCFIYGGAGAGPLLRLLPKITSSGSATLPVRYAMQYCSETRQQVSWLS